MAPANVTLNFISIFQMISKFSLTFLLIKGLLFRSLSQTRRDLNLAGMFYGMYLLSLTCEAHMCLASKPSWLVVVVISLSFYLCLVFRQPFEICIVAEKQITVCVLDA